MTHIYNIYQKCFQYPFFLHFKTFPDTLFTNNYISYSFIRIPIHFPAFSVVSLTFTNHSHSTFPHIFTIFILHVFIKSFSISPHLHVVNQYFYNVFRHFLTFINQIQCLLAYLQFRFNVRSRQRRPIIDFRELFLLAETLVRLDARAVSEELRAEKGTVAGYVAIGHTLMLRMLAGIQSLAALLATQTLRMPIVA